MTVKYILLDINYDENETKKREFEGVAGLREHLDDETLLGELLKEGIYEWEWGEWHLINLGDYL